MFIIAKNKNMKMNSETIENFEKERFYHRLRLIFTYYASHGNKQDPLIMREKNFHKFLNDSTIAQIIKSHNKQQTKTKKSSAKSKAQNESKIMQIYVDKYHKPMNFDKFLNLITKLLFQTRHQESLQQKSEEQQFQAELFNLYQQDQIVSGIFTFLYQQIEQGTQFGSLITFSQNKNFFNQEVWKQVEIHGSLLKKIYSHYFSQIIPKEQDKVSDVLSVLKRFCLDFEMAPLKVSMTEVFIIVWQIVSCKSTSIYEKDLNERQKSEEGIKKERWDAFPYQSFFKMIIMIANLIQMKEKKSDQDDYDPIIISNFFQYMGTTKGFRNIKSIYKINHSFYTHNKTSQQQPLQKYGIFEGNVLTNEKQLHFEPQRMEQTKELQVLQSFEKFLQLVFRSYTQSKKYELMLKKQLEKFCSQFKLTPHLISKRQISQIYHKILSQRNYFYLSTSNSSRLQTNRIPQENKFKINSFVSKPEFGLVFKEFLKFLAYGAQLNKISQKLTSVERLIYWIEYMFTQEKTKLLMQKSRTREKFFVQKQLNLISIYQKPKSTHLQYNFYVQHESMYKKLKKSFK